MSELDSTDAEILQQLLEDGRRSYRAIADETDLSPPSVSNRVDRLRELGVIRRFTVELDRTRLSGNGATLLSIDADPGDADDLLSDLASVEGVEHVFRTVESRVVAKAVLSPADVHDCITAELDEHRIEDYHVEPVLDSEWHPQFRGGDFDVECAICGKAVTDGETVEVESGETYRVCCSACAEEIADQYESFREAAER